MSTVVRVVLAMVGLLLSLGLLVGGGFMLMNSEGEVAEVPDMKVLEKTFPDFASPSLFVLITAPEGKQLTDSEVTALIRDTVVALNAAPGVKSSMNIPQISADKRHGLIVVSLKSAADRDGVAAVANAVAPRGGATVRALDLPDADHPPARTRPVGKIAAGFGFGALAVLLALGAGGLAFAGSGRRSSGPGGRPPGPTAPAHPYPGYPQLYQQQPQPNQFAPSQFPPGYPVPNQAVPNQLVAGQALPNQPYPTQSNGPSSTNGSSGTAPTAET